MPTYNTNVVLTNSQTTMHRENKMATANFTIKPFPVNNEKYLWSPEIPLTQDSLCS